MGGILRRLRWLGMTDTRSDALWASELASHFQERAAYFFAAPERSASFCSCCRLARTKWLFSP